MAPIAYNNYCDLVDCVERHYLMLLNNFGHCCLFQNHRVMIRLKGKEVRAMHVQIYLKYVTKKSGFPYEYHCQLSTLRCYPLSFVHMVAIIGETKRQKGKLF